MTSSLYVLVFDSSEVQETQSDAMMSSVVAGPPSKPNSGYVPALLPSLGLYPPGGLHAMSAYEPDSSTVLYVLPLNGRSLVLQDSLGIVILVSRGFGNWCWYRSLSHCGLGRGGEWGGLFACFFCCVEWGAVLSECCVTGSPYERVCAKVFAFVLVVVPVLFQLRGQMSVPLCRLLGMFLSDLS